MRAFPTDRAEDGDLLVPHPLNRELAEATSVIHSLDTWNFDDAVVLVAKLALGATGRIETFGFDDVVSINIKDGATSHDVYFVPSTGSDVPWVERVDTDDCMLHVSFGAAILFGSGVVEFPLWFGIKVDGVFVSQTGLHPQLKLGHADVHGEIPVGAGTHVIEPVFGLHPNALASGTIGSAVDVDFYDRVITVREVAR